MFCIRIDVLKSTIIKNVIPPLIAAIMAIVNCRVDFVSVLLRCFAERNCFQAC